MESTLAKRRKLLGFSQKEMAQRLNISPAAYYFYETGTKSCPANVAIQIAKILKIRINKIFLPSRFTICKEKSVSG